MHSRRKRYGQHFLNSRKIAERIAQRIGTGNDVILEIGPGKGILTEYLAERSGKVIAIELDRRWADHVTAMGLPNVEVLNHDFLGVDLTAFGRMAVAGNIPYGITTQIIEKLARSKDNLTVVLLTIQKEYGSRMTAAVAEPDYGFLSLFVNYHFDVRKEFLVPARYFAPQPKVDSVVITMRPKKGRCRADDEAKFFDFVSGVFRYRRKSVKNAVMHLIDHIPVGLDQTLLGKRPQHLNVDDFYRIWSALDRPPPLP